MGLLFVHVHIVHGEEFPAEQDPFSAIEVIQQGFRPLEQHRLRDGAQSGTQHPGDDPIPKHIRPAEQRQLLQDLRRKKHRHIGQNRAHDGIDRRRREKSAADSVQRLCRTEMNGQSVPETHFLFHNQNVFPS